MRPELRKLMVLPTPRWTALVLAAGVVIATIFVAIMGAGQDSLAEGFGISVPAWIASIVIGVWLPGLEYGQKTMRRTLSRNPNRVEVIFAKLGVVLLAATAISLIPALIAAPLFALASSGHEATISAPDTIMVGIGGLANNLVYAAAGFSFGLVTRSMAGGMTIALAFFFVIDNLLTAIPKIGDYMLTAASGEIYQAIVGTEIAGTDFDVNVLRAVLITFAWVAVFVGISSVRFLKTDID